LLNEAEAAARATGSEYCYGLVIALPVALGGGREPWQNKNAAMGH
jgi:hypothetical protein